MKINQRIFEGGGDTGRMIRLAGELRTGTIHVTDLPYRLSSWALDDPLNVALWEDERNRLLAWAVMQTPFWSVDCVYQSFPDLGLHQQILPGLTSGQGKPQVLIMGIGHSMSASCKLAGRPTSSIAGVIWSRLVLSIRSMQVKEPG